MADDIKVEDYPSVFEPVAFSDGVSGANWGNGVVKFYLYRSDPSKNGIGPTKDQVFGQIVMPMKSFVGMTMFFQNVVESMLKDGSVSQDMVEEIQKRYRDALSNG